MPKNPTANLRRNVIKAAERGSQYFITETIDLTTLNAITRPFPVFGLTLASGRINADNWGNAIVEVKRSLDAVIRTSFAPDKLTLESVSPEFFNKTLVGAPFLIFEVTTNDASADATAPIHVYAYRPNA